MKIAIPLADGLLCAHFGHCQEFALVEVDDDTKTITGQSRHTPPPHEPGVLPQWLHELGANIIIAGGMGQRAHALFAQNEISVVVGAASDSPDNLVAQYLSETLKTGENLCDH
jgi:predicted Fe-Mo cluster-binding NifX family protein